MELIQAIVLGIIQGVTEWLPVSSSGHLAIFRQFLGIGTDITFDLMLHIATLMVVVLVFHKDIASVLGAVVRRDFRSEEGKLALYVAAGTIPTGVMGYCFQSFFCSAFHSLQVVGVALIVTGLLLVQSRVRVKPKKLDCKRSIAVGILQGAAITPGISRSGATISAALLLGVDREKAVRFSFLLFIPAILGAMAFMAGDITSTAALTPVHIIAGMATSVVVGYFSLRLLIKTVLNKRFHWFFIYCWILGTILIFL